MNDYTKAMMDEAGEFIPDEGGTEEMQITEEMIKDWWTNPTPVMWDIEDAIREAKITVHILQIPMRIVAVNDSYSLLKGNYYIANVDCSMEHLRKVFGAYVSIELTIHPEK